MKKFNLILLLIALLAIMSPMTINAAQSGTCGAEGDNLTWTLDDEGTLTISGTGAMEDYLHTTNAPWKPYQSNIKKVIVESGVTTIGTNSFCDCRNLTSAIIPSSVTSIGISAFSDCSSLTSIAIPDSVTSIRRGTFSDCSSLTNITIPNNVTCIEDYAFQDCSSLTSIVIPDSVTSIGDYTFSGCSSLTNITIPDSVTSIRSGTFSDCSSLTNIMIPDSVTSIGGYAFFGCENLTNIKIPESVNSIRRDAFSNTGYYNNSNNWNNDLLYINNVLIEAKNTISKITIPNHITTIEFAAFSSCNNLTDIILPDSITVIEEKAFLWCNNLTNITIPNSVNYIGMWTFLGCENLKNIIFLGTEKEWKNITVDEENPEIYNANIEFTPVVKVLLNNAPIEFDAKPRIKNDRTMVPLRAIFEALGATVDWNAETRTVTSKKDGTEISLTVDSDIMYVNGSAVTLDAPAYITEDRTLVPVRAISEAFGVNVGWDGETRTVYLN